MATTSVIDTFLKAIESAAIPSCDAWRDDATLPNWRLHATGAEAIRAEYARWFADPGNLHDLRRCPLSDGTGEVVEYTLSWQENGVPHAAHHMHLLTIREGQDRGRHRDVRRPVARGAARRDGGSRCVTGLTWAIWAAWSARRPSGPRWTAHRASRAPGLSGP